MIDTDFNWTEPLNLVLAVAALALLMAPGVLLYKRHRYAGRFGIRLVLNALLWLSVVLWMLDPSLPWARRARTGVLTAAHVPDAVAASVQDSLSNAERIRADELRERDLDTLVIVGQEFDPWVFAAIRQLEYAPVLHWKPYFATGQLQNLQWKGIVRKGEMQRIQGSVQLSQKQALRVRYAGQSLDSAMLGAGMNHFSLAFPAFGEGRTSVTLDLGGETIDTVRFFAQPAPPLTVRFLVDHPDFETRSLATWLGKQGHAVRYDATLSTNVRSALNINRAVEPDLIVTSASNAAAVRKAVNAGKSVLFLQLTDPTAEVRTVNNALGTRFQATKIANEASVPVKPSLTALPFRFAASGFQTLAPHYPVAIENMAGKVAVSLLNETFPMQLAGDSVGYGQVWNEILAYARPAQGPVLACNAPVFAGVPVTLHLNSPGSIQRQVTPGKDTVFTNVSALNAHSATARFLPNAAGWLPLHDSLQTEIYVQSSPPLQAAAYMQHFIRSSQNNTPFSGTRQDTTPGRKLPDWAWFAWLMLVCTALWIEPKL